MWAPCSSGTSASHWPSSRVATTRNARRLIAAIPSPAPVHSSSCLGSAGFGACSGVEEVVVDVLLPLVAEKRDDVPEVRAPCSQVAGGEQVCARAGADKQPELVRQAA